jgi:SAM-dependent methyltransferase
MSLDFRWPSPSSGSGAGALAARAQREENAWRRRLVTDAGHCASVTGVSHRAMGFILPFIDAVRILWAKVQLTAPLRRVRRHWTWSRDCSLVEHILASSAEDSYLEPYERLAEIYDQVYRDSIPNYGAFLTALTRRYGLALESALDLACGTGMVTRQLAGIAKRVIGLDCNQRMLDQARSLHVGLENVRFERGDFRAFHLEDRFDAVVCASDSLNYVNQVSELRRVFERVFEHLQPGGIFVFDVVNSFGSRRSADFTGFYDSHGSCFAFCSQYDRHTRIVNSFVKFDSGTERHRRVAIDVRDVQAGAHASGLLVDDYFSDASGGRSFYLLRRPGKS